MAVDNKSSIFNIYKVFILKTASTASGKCLNEFGQFFFYLNCVRPTTCSQNRQSTKFQNHENINFVERLYFFILFNQVYIAKHDVKPLHSGFIFRENTSHYKVGG